MVCILEERGLNFTLINDTCDKNFNDVVKGRVVLKHILSLSTYWSSLSFPPRCALETHTMWSDAS